MIPRIKIQNRDKGTMWSREKFPHMLRGLPEGEERGMGGAKEMITYFSKLMKITHPQIFEVQHIPNHINENNSTSNLIRRKVKNTKGKS